jgi:hypothetical protein
LRPSLACERNMGCGEATDFMDLWLALLAHRAGSHVRVIPFAIGVIAEVRSTPAAIAFNALDPFQTCTPRCYRGLSKR